MSAYCFEQNTRLNKTREKQVLARGAIEWTRGLLHCICPQVAVRPEGANHQWRKNPPGNLSIDPVADERLMRITARVGAS